MRIVAIELATGRKPQSLLPQGYGVGTLYITTVPSGASVWIDEIPIDEITPATVKNINEGNRVIYVEKDDYYGSKNVVVTADVVNRVSVSLKKRQATLNVYSTPDGAEVSIDGRKYGNTPLTIEDLTVGTHNIIISKPEWLPYISKVQLDKDKVNTVEVDLKKQPILSVYSKPIGAQIYVGNDLLGITPKENIDIYLGESKITLKGVKGYEEYTETIIFKPGDKKTINANLVKKSGSLKIEDYEISDVNFEVIEDKSISGVSPSTVDYIPVGSYTLLFHKQGYLSQQKKIEIKWKQTTTVSPSLQSVNSIEKEIETLKRKRDLWVYGFYSLMGMGAYFYYSSNKHYDEYLQTETNADDIYSTVEFEDKLYPISFGLGVVSLLPIVFTQMKIDNLNKILETGVIKD